MFIQYLSNFLKEPVVYSIPYNSGWRKTDSGYLYCMSSNNRLSIVSPYFKNHFNLTGNSDPISNIRDALGLYCNYFKNEETRIIMLASLTYSLLVSIFRDKYRLSINKILIINSTNYNSNLINRTADMFLNVFDKKSYPNFGNSVKKLKKYISDTKDEPLILIGGKENSYYHKNNNIAYIRKCFIEGSELDMGDVSISANCFPIS